MTDEQERVVDRLQELQDARLDLARVQELICDALNEMDFSYRRGGMSVNNRDRAQRVGQILLEGVRP